MLIPWLSKLPEKIQPMGQQFVAAETFEPSIDLLAGEIKVPAAKQY
jgi:hypothetical protein